MAIALRRLEDADLDRLFAWESDPRAVALAAFTRADPADRAAFDAHYTRIRSNSSNTIMAIEQDGALVGTVSSFTMEGEREVSYWIAPERWGEGLASAALGAFLRVESSRPLFGRVAEQNRGSARVLARAGFQRIGSDVSFAAGVGRDVVEIIFRLSGE